MVQSKRDAFMTVTNKNDHNIGYLKISIQTIDFYRFYYNFIKCSCSLKAIRRFDTAV